jgi:hypothetical protein
VYHAWRNRHCPKCQGAARAKWVAAAETPLLPVPYFPVLFPLPHLLNPLIRVNPRTPYTLLFQTVARTLQQFARDPQPLGAELGLTAVLHPGGQTLTEQIHVHCVVRGGGLTAEGTPWRPSHPRFLFAVEALSQVFRGKDLAGLRRLRAKPRLHFAGESAALAEPAVWQAFLGQLQDRPWVGYAKPPWGGPEQGLQYLSRSVHGVAISNARLVFAGEGMGHFRYKNYAARGSTQTMEWSATEFLRRFLLHVLPPHFVRAFATVAS